LIELEFFQQFPVTVCREAADGFRCFVCFHFLSLSLMVWFTICWRCTSFSLRRKRRLGARRRQWELEQARQFWKERP
jgi:hypothetical protein